MFHDFAADFAHGEAVFAAHVVGAPCKLHGLQGYAAHTGLAGGKADDVADFVVVHAFGNSYHQRGG